MQTNIDNSKGASSGPRWAYSGDIGGDQFDIRDLIARVEELEDEIENINGMPEGDLLKDTIEGEDMRQELKFLTDFLEEVKGAGGDEQWRGDWYPVGFIADHYFTQYAMDMLQDCGDLPKDIPWYIAIDEEKTATNIQGDYSSVDFNGDTYWYR